MSVIDDDRTSWLRVFVLLFGGIAVSFLIGKVPASLALLRSELQMSLFEAGLTVSIYSLVAGLIGVLCGIMSDRAGQRRVALSGMVLAAAASFAGAFAPTPLWLLAARAGEGLGFFLTVVSLPALMLSVASTRGRQVALGLWSTYMPTGMGTMLLFGGLVVATIGWRNLWLVNGGLVLAAALGVAWASSGAPEPGAAAGRKPALEMARAALKPGPVLLAVVFGTYAAQFLTVTAFLPLILTDDAGWSVASAGLAGATVIIANIIGCVASGWLLEAGAKRSVLIVAVSVTMAVCAILVLLPHATVVRVAAAIVFSAVGGLIPGVLFSGVPVHAPSPQLMATVNGLMLQGTAFGQLVGPAAASWVAEQTGDWTGALIICLPLALAATLGGLMLGRLEQAKGPER